MKKSLSKSLSMRREGAHLVLKGVLELSGDEVGQLAEVRLSRGRTQIDRPRLELPFLRGNLLLERLRQLRGLRDLGNGLGLFLFRRYDLIGVSSEED